MKLETAKVCLAVAFVLFLGGDMMLCACPGLYALAAAFAGVAVWAGKGRIRLWSIVCLIASLTFTGLDTLSLVRDHRRQNQMNAPTNAAPKTMNSK